MGWEMRAEGAGQKETVSGDPDMRSDRAAGKNRQQTKRAMRKQKEQG